MKPAISVIVPFYNIEQYVSYCLDSILAQTFRDFELICINDGSKDGTRELLDAYAEKDSRIKVIHQENQGQSVARNNALKRAVGKYIAFIDGDDAVIPEYLEVLYKEAERAKPDLVFCKSSLVIDNKQVTTTYREGYSVEIFDDSIAYRHLSKQIRLPSTPWGKLYRKEFLGDIPFEPGIYFEDYLFLYTSLFRLKKVVGIDAVMYLNTITPGSTINSPFSMKKAYSHLIIYDREMELAEKFCTPQEKPFLRKKAIGQIRRLLRGLATMEFQKLQEILPEVQSHITERYVAGKLSLHDFSFKYRLCLFALIKHWDKYLPILLKLA